MNQTQLKYARERATRTLNARKDAITKAHTTEAISMSAEERLQALKDGRFRVVDKGKAFTPFYWFQGVKFTDERPRKVNQKAIDLEHAALQTQYDELIGELVLGDNEQALALLKAFEAAA